MTITIRPHLALQTGGALTSPVPYDTAGAIVSRLLHKDSHNVIIWLDLKLGDDDVKVPGDGGELLSEPVWLLVAHELIHANHYTHGDVTIGESRNPMFPGEYGAEEERTIMTGNPSENTFRRAWKLPRRIGHTGADFRF